MALLCLSELGQSGHHPWVCTVPHGVLGSSAGERAALEPGTLRGSVGAAGEVTAPCTGTGIQTGAAEPRPGRTGPRCSWGWGSSCSPLSQGGHTELQSLSLCFWKRAKAVPAAEQWLHPALSRQYHSIGQVVQTHSATFSLNPGYARLDKNILF